MVEVSKARIAGKRQIVARAFETLIKLLTLVNSDLPSLTRPIDYTARDFNLWEGEKEAYAS